jgi:hypothetical protein
METLDFLGSLGSNHLGSTQEVAPEVPRKYPGSTQEVGEYINKVSNKKILS